MFNDYIITRELLKKKGYHFFSKGDEKMFIKYIQDEFERMIGAATKHAISEEVYDELESAALDGNQELVTDIIEEHIPGYPNIIDGVWLEINELLSKNADSVERIMKIIGQRKS